MDTRRTRIPSFFQRMVTGPESPSTMEPAPQVDETGIEGSARRYGHEEQKGPLKRQKKGVELSGSPSVPLLRDGAIGVNSNYSIFRERQRLGSEWAVGEQSHWPSRCGAGFGGQRGWIPPFGRKHNDVAQNTSVENFGGRSGAGVGLGLAELGCEAKPRQLLDEVPGGAGWKDGTLSIGGRSGAGAGPGLAELSWEAKPGQLLDEMLGVTGWKDGTLSIGEKGPWCCGDLTGSSGIDVVESSSVKMERGVAGGRGFRRGAGCGGGLASTLLVSGSAGFGSGSAIGSSAISEADAVVGELRKIPPPATFFSAHQSLVPGLTGSAGSSRLVHGVWGGVRNSGRACLEGKERGPAWDGSQLCFQKPDKEDGCTVGEDGANKKLDKGKVSEIRGGMAASALADRPGHGGSNWEGAKGHELHFSEDACRIGVSRKELDEARRSMVAGAVERSSAPQSGRLPFVWRMEGAALDTCTLLANAMSHGVSATADGIDKGDGSMRSDVDVTKLFELWRQKGREQEREAAIAAAEAEDEVLGGNKLEKRSWEDLVRKDSENLLEKDCKEECNALVKENVDSVIEIGKRKEESEAIIWNGAQRDESETGVTGRRAEAETFSKRRESKAACAALSALDLVQSTNDLEAVDETQEEERREQEQIGEGRSGSRGNSSSKKRRRDSNGQRQDEQIWKGGGQDSSSHERRSGRERKSEKHRSKMEQKERERESRHLQKESDGGDQWSGCKTESRKPHRVDNSDSKRVRYFQERTSLDGESKREQIRSLHVKGKGSFSAWFDVLKGGMMGIGRLGVARSTGETVGDKREGNCESDVDREVEKRSTGNGEVERADGREHATISQNEGGEDRARRVGGRLAQVVGSRTQEAKSKDRRGEGILQGRVDERRDTQEGGRRGEHAAAEETDVPIVHSGSGATVGVDTKVKSIAPGLVPVVGGTTRKLASRELGSQVHVDRQVMWGNRTVQLGYQACQKGEDDVERLEGNEAQRRSAGESGPDSRVGSGETPVFGVGYPKASMWSLLTSTSALQPQDQKSLPGQLPRPMLRRHVESSSQHGQGKSVTEVMVKQSLGEKSPVPSWQYQTGQDSTGGSDLGSAAVGGSNTAKALDRQTVALQVPVPSKAHGSSGGCWENQPELGTADPKQTPSVSAKDVRGPFPSVPPIEYDQKKDFTADVGPGPFSFMAGEQQEFKNSNRREQPQAFQGSAGQNEFDFRHPASIGLNLGGSVGSVVAAASAAGMSSINVPPQVPSVAADGEMVTLASGGACLSHSVLESLINAQVALPAIKVGPSGEKEVGDMDGVLCQSMGLQQSAYMPYEKIAERMGKAGEFAPHNACLAADKPETKTVKLLAGGGSMAPDIGNMVLQPASAKVEVGHGPMFCLGDDGSGEAAKGHGFREYKAKMAAVRKWNLESAKLRGRQGRSVGNNSTQGGFILAEAVAMTRISQLECMFCGMRGHELDECSETLDAELPYLLRSMVKLREKQGGKDLRTDGGTEDDTLLIQCLRCLRKGHWGSHCLLSVSEVLAIHGQTEMYGRDDGPEQILSERKVGGESSVLLGSESPVPGHYGTDNETGRGDRVSKKHPLTRGAEEKVGKALERHNSSKSSGNWSREDSADKDSGKQRQNAAEETFAGRGFEHEHEGKGREGMSERGSGFRRRAGSERQEDSSRSRRKREKQDVEKARNERWDREERSRGREERYNRDRGRGKGKDTTRHRDRGRGKDRVKERVWERSSNNEDNSKAFQGGLRARDGDNENNGWGQVKSVSQIPLKPPHGMLQALESVRLPRRELIRLAGKRDFSARVSGFFLRLRFGRKQEGLGRSGYRMAQIRGAVKESGGRENARLALDVDFGDITCTIDGQYVSNKSFHEVELLEWWNGACRMKGHHPITLEQIVALRDSLSCGS